MDGLAISWVIRGIAFAVAAAIGFAYLLTPPRTNPMVLPRTLVLAWACIVGVWQVIERPTAGDGGIPFSDPLIWSIGLAWMLVAVQGALESIHVIRHRKARSGINELADATIKKNGGNREDNVA